ncbi:hypothetical protein J7T55_015174 [Diaporthe amygdali]|uniref:uncharacterized protein n=1 Tax=Phomopsis amygdali TaxID=1214568 RepID=UPI0022FF4276|nr:uncharacterized protein J7T55_015174 [Diaporthe amygdali]KAJ0120447.1 hypothetical protein J7T55_015174 [Diaporthe amygdali]
MQLTTSNCSGRRLAVLLLVFLQSASGLALPTSTQPSSQWPSLIETVRFLVSRWLNETTAIIVIGVIVGLSAASFAVYGFDWKDYEGAPPDRLVDDGEQHGCQRPTKPTDV